MTIKIDYQGIHLEGQLIAPDTPEWYEWLATAKSFRFELSHETWVDGRVPMVETLTFSGVKVGSYWQAHKKSGGLRREYLGKSPSYAKLKETSVLINSDSYWHQKQRSAKPVPEGSHKSSYETRGEYSSQAGDEIAKLKAELERVTQDRDNLLIKLGNGKIQASEDAQQRIKQLEARVTELDNANWELEKRYTQVNDLWYRSEQKQTELQAQLNECKSSTQPSALDLLSQYETNYETVKPTLPKPPKDLTRNWVEFWRFKAWLESR